MATVIALVTATVMAMAMAMVTAMVMATALVMAIAMEMAMATAPRRRRQSGADGCSSGRWLQWKTTVAADN
jgi:hypothetical protein